MSSTVPTRDPEQTARTLEAWLTQRLDASRVSVSGLSIPKAGFSNETMIGDAEWSDAAGEHALEFVLRIQPTAHQLFVQPDALRQARVMEALAGQVPVPDVLLSEDDESVLGAPFFLMRRVHGRIPSDVPSWHQRGWTTELGADQQCRLHDNALTELVRLHRVDTSSSEFGFLESDGSGTALERYVGHLATWHDWCRPVIRYGVDVIDAALEYVTGNVPDDPRRSVMWGDARVGNIIFDNDLSVAAMLDWEGASLAPPELDVAWWVMFDEFLCESQGLTRLPGVHDGPATFERYAELSGELLRNIGFYEVLVGFQFALINSRLADRLISTGKTPEALAASFVTRVTAITRRALDNAG